MIIDNKFYMDNIPDSCRNTDSEAKKRLCILLNENRQAVCDNCLFSTGNTLHIGMSRGLGELDISDEELDKIYQRVLEG